MPAEDRKGVSLPSCQKGAECHSALCWQVLRNTSSSLWGSPSKCGLWVAALMSTHIKSHLNNHKVLFFFESSEYKIPFKKYPFQTKLSWAAQNLSHLQYYFWWIVPYCSNWTGSCDREAEVQNWVSIRHWNKGSWSLPVNIFIQKVTRPVQKQWLLVALPRPSWLLPLAIAQGILKSGLAHQEMCSQPKLRDSSRTSIF